MCDREQERRKTPQTTTNFHLHILPLLFNYLTQNNKTIKEQCNAHTKLQRGHRSLNSNNMSNQSEPCSKNSSGITWQVTPSRLIVAVGEKGEDQSWGRGGGVSAARGGGGRAVWWAISSALVKASSDWSATTTLVRAVTWMGSKATLIFKNGKRGP